MKLSVQFRKWHKWLSLFIGIQAFLWIVSGVYMVTVDLDFIHGDQLVQKMDEPLSVKPQSLVPISDIQIRYPDARAINLVSWLGNPFYRVYGVDNPKLIDATTGDLHAMLNEGDARRVAEYHFAEEGEIVSAILINESDEKPSEISTRALPLWQISYDDAIASNFYISPYDGRLVTRRHSFWRAFDFLWMLHIMDYETRDDVNNNLLRIVAIIGTVMSTAGVGLLFYSFRKRKGKAKPKKQTVNKFMRVTHKWVGLVLGIQVFLWMLSGFVLSWYEYDVVEGNNLRNFAHSSESQMQPAADTSAIFEATSATEVLKEVSARRFRGEDIILVRTDVSIRMFNAATSTHIAIDQTLAEAIAIGDFSGDGDVISVTPIVAPTMETRESTGPGWRVDFNNDVNSSLYVSAETGAIWERRNDIWRTFDIYWMLHIMDFENRKDFNNVIVILVSWISLWIALSGIILTINSLQKGEFKSTKKTKRRGQLKNKGSA